MSIEKWYLNVVIINFEEILLIFGRKKDSARAISGEYGGSSMVRKLNFIRQIMLRFLMLLFMTSQNFKLQNIAMNYESNLFSLLFEFVFNFGAV